jgi:hypothetical protein
MNQLAQTSILVTMGKRAGDPRGKAERFLTVPLTAKETEAMLVIELAASDEAGRRVSAAEVVRGWIAGGRLPKL